MTHEEKWKRIEAIDARLLELQAEAKKLAADKFETLMTRASDEDRHFVPWRNRKAS